MASDRQAGDDILQMPVWKSYLYYLQQQAPQPKRAISQKEPPNKPPYYGREFHGAISREDTDFLLTIGGEGSYLIRESQRAPGQYTLAIRFEGVTKNFKLYYDGMHYVGEKRFDTVQDLVADGLITFYLESKAADYIAALSNQSNYAESPYMAYTAQKRRQHMRKKVVRKSADDESLQNDGQSKLLAKEVDELPHNDEHNLNNRQETANDILVPNEPTSDNIDGRNEIRGEQNRKEVRNDIRNEARGEIRNEVRNRRTEGRVIGRAEMRAQRRSQHEDQERGHLSKQGTDIIRPASIAAPSSISMVSNAANHSSANRASIADLGSSIIPTSTSNSVTPLPSANHTPSHSASNQTNNSIAPSSQNTPAPVTATPRTARANLPVEGRLSQILENRKAQDAIGMVTQVLNNNKEELSEGRVSHSTNTDGPKCDLDSRSRSPLSQVKSLDKHHRFKSTMLDESHFSTPPSSPTPGHHGFDKSNSFKVSSVSWCTDFMEVMGCEKPHNFKLHTFKGPHWCDFCANFLWGLIAQGVKCQDCGFNAHKKCSEKVPNDCMPDMRYVKRMFGVDLTTLVKAQNTLIPTVVEMCIKEIEARGVDAEGIYRVAGFHDDVEFIKLSFDRDGDLTDIGPDRYEDINTITSLLKLYFRVLPIPLITFDIYYRVIDTVKQENLLDEEKLEMLRHALMQLPPAHYHTLKYLMSHLHRVTEQKQDNMMSAENLAIVFAPTLLRSPETDPLTSLSAVKYERELIELLISHHHKIFDQ